MDDIRSLDGRKKGSAMKPRTGIYLALLLTLGFAIYRGPDFRQYEARANAIAAQVAVGRRVMTPFKLGHYTVHQVGMQNGVVYFWTRKRASGNSGLVQHPEGKGFNLWSCKRLSENWAFIEED